MSEHRPGEIRDPETGKLVGREIWYKVRAALAVSLAFGVLAGGGWVVYDRAQAAWTDYRTAEDYPGTGVDPIEVTIPKGATLAEISVVLVDAGVVKTAKSFDRAAAANSDAKRIQAGRYNLKTKLPAKLALAMLLDPANIVRDRMVLREGQTLDTAVTAMSKASKVPQDQFSAALKDWRKLGLPKWAKRGAEGFIFPDTYELPAKPSAAAVIELTATRFNEVATEIQFEEGATALGYTPYEVLIVASIVEKEAGRDEDRAKVARVIYNRLDDGMRLQLDSTVSYAAKETGKVATTAEMRASRSPYNTYVVPGLPIGPISNPSRKSMEAALKPAEGPWRFFVAVNLDTGETEFNETAAGHNQSVAKWRDWCAASEANRKKCFG